MAEVLAGLLLLLLLLFWASNFFNIPGNWINIGLIGFWKWLHPSMPAGWWFFIGLVCIAALAEGLEFGTQVWGAKKYGASSKGGWGALIGALVGAVFGAPFFLGLGAIFGAVAGAFAGSLVVELLSGRSWSRALHASKGAMWGKVFGFAAKAGLGMLMISLAAPKVWP